ncbi:hypothetical protein ASD44_10740 [Mesorhizobium sp. Root554]|uniref:orotate phosphoribosyltransferase n=1 Tax=unclassified Mesorhizobium TaxID=325217 RepID=UPI000700607B|nr:MULTISPECIES: phosphoribosyltransferase family protein [unclassified Mesorhizobium]KQZ14494.1 hypothetical protein ASD27_10750 [Mesorhizobium sp. Root1471]KQZ37002.1 hypothetical protein ASD44_10740 [Mesorhizobium sp. Root554]
MAQKDRSAIARGLWEIKAVHVRFDSPVTLPHAQPSPLFIDNRRVFSEPPLRRLIVDSMIEDIKAPGGEPVRVIIGDETAGIPLAAWVADRLDLPLTYVRKKPKGHGLPNLIEGGDVDGKPAVLITDLINVGESILPGLRQLLEKNVKIEQVIAIVQRSPNRAYQPYAPMGIHVRGLIHVTDLVAAGRDGGYLSADAADRLLAYLESASKEPVYAEMLNSTAV